MHFAENAATARMCTNTNIKNYYFLIKEQNGIDFRSVFSMITHFIVAMVFDFLKVVAKSTVVYFTN